MNKYDSIATWLLTYPNIGEWLYFNVSNVEVDNVSLNSVSGERTLVKFNDGSAECELTFAVSMFKSYDTGTSDINLNALHECENLADWCEEQNAIRNLPTFTGSTVNEIKILDSVPDVAVDNEQGIAKYMIQGKINFLKNRR